MSFDLKHVQSFVAVAETLSFSVAAAQLNTVQSAISAHIKTLEVQLNRTLLDRGRGRGAAQTAEGAAFLVQARRLLALAEEMARDPGAAQGAAPLRLGTTVTFAQSVVPPALKAFAAGKHATPVTVRTARSHHLMDLLENGEIDLRGANLQRADLNGLHFEKALLTGAHLQGASLRRARLRGVKPLCSDL